MTVARSAWWRLVPLLVLLAALTPRAVSLGSFVTADEPTWLERSIWFVAGIAQGDDGLLRRAIYGDLVGAPASALPGLLPMPLPLVGLGTTAFLTSALTGGVTPGQHTYSDTIVLLGQTAWFTALLTSGAVVAAYGLLCPLWGRPTALLAALALALDPYFIGLSRVVGVDALLAAFMLLAAVALFRAASGSGRARFWGLLLAGACAVLALLTKMPALFLWPFAGVVATYGALVAPARRRWLLTSLAIMLVALAVGLGALLLAWPNPAQALETLVDAVGAGVTQVHEGGSYAFGAPGRPLDASFYVWVLALRATPFTLVGLILAFFAGLAAIRRWREPEVGTVLLLVIYLVGFWAMMTLGAKKQDRYILPALLVLDLLAAWGWWQALRWGLGRLPRLQDHAHRWALSGGIALLLLVTPFWLRLHPYYLAAYNPLLGGSKTAAWVYAVGWGEGLEQASAYLQAAHPDPADVVVAAHMAQALGAEFPGFVVPLTTDTQYVADHVVLYYADALRNVPEPWVIDRFRSQTPAFIAWIDGVPYAGVYRNPDLPRKLVSRRPPPVERPLDVLLGRWVRCVGADLPAESVSPGTMLTVTLHWECREPMSVDYRGFVTLVATREAGRAVGQWDHEPLGGHLATSFWQPGLFLRDEFEVPVPADAPAGVYQLQAGLYNPLTHQRLRTPAGDDHFTIGTITIR